jgi:hypothetical protein
MNITSGASKSYRKRNKFKAFVHNNYVDKQNKMQIKESTKESAMYKFYFTRKKNYAKNVFDTGELDEEFSDDEGDYVGNPEEE